MFKLNKKGFTLVELLAVIVVLAIIMLIAIPSVMKQMESAKVGTFKIYAQKVLTKGEEQFQIDSMMGNITDTTTKCYTLETMGINSSGTYRGKVVVTIDANLKPTYTLYLSDNSYSVSNVNFTNINGIKNAESSTLEEPFTATSVGATCS